MTILNRLRGMKNIFKSESKEPPKIDLTYNQSFTESLLERQTGRMITRNKLIADNLNNYESADTIVNDAIHDASVRQTLETSQIPSSISQIMTRARNSHNAETLSQRINQMPKSVQESYLRSAEKLRNPAADNAQPNPLVRESYNRSQQVSGVDVKDQLSSEADETLKMYNNGTLPEEDFVKKLNNLNDRYTYAARENIVQMQGNPQPDNLDSVLSRIQKRADSTSDKARQYRIRSVADKIRDYQTQEQYFTNTMRDATTAKDKLTAKHGLDNMHQQYGVKNPADAANIFEREANQNPEFMDYMMGYHVPQTALGMSVLYGAVSNVFSNKGRVNNSQLYNPF